MKLFKSKGVKSNSEMKGKKMKRQAQTKKTQTEGRKGKEGYDRGVHHKSLESPRGRLPRETGGGKGRDKKRRKRV